MGRKEKLYTKIKLNYKNMYNLIEIRAEQKISEDRSKISTKYFKIRNLNELKEIDIGEYIELKQLGVKEYALYELEDLMKITNTLIMKEKKMKLDLKKWKI